jgi:hypothetical protein
VAEKIKERRAKYCSQTKNAKKSEMDSAGKHA